MSLSRLLSGRSTISFINLLHGSNKQLCRNMGIEFNRDPYWQERIGNREVVGYGMNGQPFYFDRSTHPFPAIRYKESTTQLRCLLEKQKCNWKLLSIEEKRELYRANFCLTFAEFQAPTGEWMEIVGYGLIVCCLGVWLWILLRLCLDHDTPQSFTPENMKAQMKRKLDMHHEPILGYSSYFDYNKNQWKKGWLLPKESPYTDDGDEGESDKSTENNAAEKVSEEDTPKEE